MFSKKTDRPTHQFISSLCAKRHNFSYLVITQLRVVFQVNDFFLSVGKFFQRLFKLSALLVKTLSFNNIELYRRCGQDLKKCRCQCKCCRPLSSLYRFSDQLSSDRFKQVRFYRFHSTQFVLGVPNFHKKLLNTVFDQFFVFDQF